MERQLDVAIVGAGLACAARLRGAGVERLFRELWSGGAVASAA